MREGEQGGTRVWVQAVRWVPMHQLFLSERSVGKWGGGGMREEM